MKVFSEGQIVHEFVGLRTEAELRELFDQLAPPANPALTPRAIDLTPDRGPAAGLRLKGIYEIDRQLLTVCYVRVGADNPALQPRPEGFDTHFDPIKRFQE